jgi:hypothetical protein
MQTSNTAEMPVVIETAITPLRFGEPVQSMEQTIEESRACLAAGTAIIHHHHDFSAPRAEGIRQMVGIQAGILEAFPGALMYSDYLNGTGIWEKNAHLRPLHDAGLLRMIPLDPAIVQVGKLDQDGLPSDSHVAGLTYAQSAEVVRFARETNVPMSISIYEPGNLRWARAYALAGMFPAGSMIKLFFGGPYTIGLHRVPGVNFGLHPTKAALDIYLSMMEGMNLPWIVSCLAGVLLETPIAQYALERGGHLRIGIEDTAGGSDMSNVESVVAARELAAKVGRPVVSGEAAKQLLKRSERALAA